MSSLLWSAVGERMRRDGASRRQRITVHPGEPDPLTGEAVTPWPRKVKAPPPSVPSAAFLRGAMPAGDPVSWGAITASTLLDEEPALPSFAGASRSKQG